MLPLSGTPPSHLLNRFPSSPNNPRIDERLLTTCRTVRYADGNTLPPTIGCKVVEPMPRKAKRGCCVEDCERQYYARGLCRRHYMRQRRTGTTEPRPKSRCSVIGCKEDHAARGFCDYHYDQVTKGYSAEWTLLARRCRVSGCERPHKRGGFCQHHARKVSAARHAHNVDLLNRGRSN